MKFTLLVVGRTVEKHYITAIDDYVARTKHFTQFDMEVIPELKGRMTGMSFRVPTNDVSVVDLTARLIQPATYHDICVAMRNAAKNSMRGIITCTEDQVVSSDLTGFTETCIFDETAGIMLDDDFVKLIAWYDNEWGYTNKLLDLIDHMYAVDHADDHGVL